MEWRTRTQEMNYHQALGYAWGVKDHASHNSEMGRKAMVAGSTDFAMWFAGSTERPHTIADAWELFVEFRPEEQRRMADRVKTLPYRESVTAGR